METPKKIDWQNLTNWVNAQNAPKPIRTIKASLLKRIAGGLYRIRDDYESVWRMVEGSDGRSYIVRADDESDKQLVLAEDTTDVQSRSAFRTFTASGEVNVVWECNECDYPNITKEGESYECGQCHSNTQDVFGQGDVSQAGVTVEQAVATYGPNIGRIMRRHGIKYADPTLIGIWKNAAMYKCKSCGHDYVSDGSDTCPKCSSPEVVKNAATMNKCKSCGHDYFSDSQSNTCPKCDSPEVSGEI